MSLESPKFREISSGTEAQMLERLLSKFQNNTVGACGLTLARRSNTT